MKHLSLISVCILLAQSTVFAIENSPTQVPSLYCPQPESISRNGLNWEAKTVVTWKTYESSFGDGIKQFLGAQWSGVKVGTVICIYESTTPGVFPINLQNNNMFREPTQANWKVGKDDYFNCVSNDIKDCPLTPQVKEAVPQTTSAIFDSLNIQK